MKKNLLINLPLLILLNSCFSIQLNPGAGLVQVLSQSESKRCSFVSRIDTGRYNMKSYQDAQIILRNIAFEMGANAILVENVQAGKVASGKALKCSQSSLPRVNKTQDIKAHRKLTQNTKQTPPQKTINTNTKKATNHTARTQPTIHTNQNTANTRGDVASFQGQNWQRCGYGQYMASNTCQGKSVLIKWRAAIKYCDNLRLAGKNWKLPSSSQLQNLLVEKQGSAVRIDLQAFPRSQPALYWTNSIYESNNQVAWTVDFKTGTSFAFGTTNKAFVRCIAIE